MGVQVFKLQMLLKTGRPESGSIGYEIENRNRVSGGAVDSISVRVTEPLPDKGPPWEITRPPGREVRARS